MTHVSRLRLSVPKPFTLKATVLGYGYYELPPFLWDGAVLRRAESMHGRVYLLKLREQASHSPERAALALTLSSDTPVPGASRHELARRARRMLKLDHDLSEFYALCRREARLRFIPRLGLGRLLRGSSLFEDLVKTISWSNTTWTQAVRMIRRIGDLGDPCPVLPTLRVWPGPERVREAGRAYLEKEARLGYRAPFILELAERVVSGELDLEQIEALQDPAESTKALLAIKGVGPASAAYVHAMLGHYDRPILDSATLAYLARAHVRGRRPTAAHVERRLAPYGRWKGLVFWFDYWFGSGRGKRYGFVK